MNKFFLNSVLFFLALSLFAPPALGGEEKKRPEKQKFEELQKKIEDKQARIQQVEKKEEKVISELDRIEKDLSRKQRDLKNYEVSLKKQEQKIRNLNQEIETLEEEINQEKERLADHIKVLYQLGRLSFTKAAFSSDSFPTLTRRYGYLMRLIDYNIGSITAYTEKLNLLQQEEQNLQASEKQLETMTVQARSVQKKIMSHQEEKTTLLAKVRSEKKLQLKALEELKQASLRLQSLIDKLDKQKTIASFSPQNVPKGYPFSVKGKLDFPVPGKVVTYFGEHEDPEFATVSFNKGIEINAQRGSPIKAVLNGTVIYSGWFKGYGNIIIVDHGAGLYTLSGHAAELFKQVGEHVNTGEPIGSVGDTGSLKGPNLYFEIRHHGQPLDPLSWLKR